VTKIYTKNIHTGSVRAQKEEEGEERRRKGKEKLEMVDRALLILCANWISPTTINWGHFIQFGWARNKKEEKDGAGEGVAETEVCTQVTQQQEDQQNGQEMGNGAGEWRMKNVEWRRELLASLLLHSATCDNNKSFYCRRTQMRLCEAHRYTNTVTKGEENR